MNEITITIPIDTVNAAISALAKFPYDQAQPHIDVLRSRAIMAVQEQERAAKDLDAKPVDPKVEPANE